MLTLVSLGTALWLAASPAAVETAAQNMAVAEADTNAIYERRAREWLALVDKGNWEVSHARAGKVFRTANSVERWQAASEMARGPLGAVVDRKAIAFQEVPSPERYQIVRFQTQFENQPRVIETVTLQPEDGEYRVVGYFLS